MTTTAERFRGCLLGGAVGDALGAPAEFLRLDEIRRVYGAGGIRDYDARTGGLITDDTQMTLFTAEGLIRAHARWLDRGLCHPPSVVRRAYMRWLDTQGEATTYGDPDGIPINTGWLVGQPELRQRRAPGMTCVGALSTGGLGTPDHPYNASKGCGGVMRVAPVGLVANDPFTLGCEVAAITHGHPTGFLAAGAFALMISVLMTGGGVGEAVDEAIDALLGYPDGGEVIEALDRASRAALNERATPGTIEWLGQGWVAEEALAIAVFCSLKADDFSSGVLLAVNHSGDSDSTGSMTGSLLGTAGGIEAIPRRWLEGLEARTIIETLADDLERVQHFSSTPLGWEPTGHEMTVEFLKKYPPN